MVECRYDSFFLHGLILCKTRTKTDHPLQIRTNAGAIDWDQYFRNLFWKLDLSLYFSLGSSLLGKWT